MNYKDMLERLMEATSHLCVNFEIEAMECQIEEVLACREEILAELSKFEPEGHGEPFLNAFDYLDKQMLRRMRRAFLSPLEECK